MNNSLLHLLLKITPRKTKLNTSQFLTNFSRILTESHFYSDPEIKLNGELNFIKNPPLPIKVVVDAGANRGDWSANLLSTNTMLDVLVLIEPNPLLLEGLRNRFRKEKCVRIISEALDFRKDKLRLSYPDNADSHATLATQPFRKETNCRYTTAEVHTNTIDSIVEEIEVSSIDLLKLDLEGFDHYALLGGRKALSEGKIKVIQFEVTREWESAGCSPCSTFRLLTGCGFRLYHIRPTGLEHLHNPEQIPHFSLYSNFCAIHTSISPPPV